MLEWHCCIPGDRPLAHSNGAPQAAIVRPSGLDQASLAAGARRQRVPIAIARALDNRRGVRRGFLPRGLCNTCPDVAVACECLRARAGVTQALTEAVGRLEDPGRVEHLDSCRDAPSILASRHPAQAGRRFVPFRVRRSSTAHVQHEEMPTTRNPSSRWSRPSGRPPCTSQQTALLSSVFTQSAIECTSSTSSRGGFRPLCSPERSANCSSMLEPNCNLIL